MSNAVHAPAGAPQPRDGRVYFSEDALAAPPVPSPSVESALSELGAGSPHLPSLHGGGGATSSRSVQRFFRVDERGKIDAVACSRHRARPRGLAPAPAPAWPLVDPSPGRRPRRSIQNREASEPLFPPARPPQIRDRFALAVRDSRILDPVRSSSCGKALPLSPLPPSARPWRRPSPAARLRPRLSARSRARAGRTLSTKTPRRVLCCAQLRKLHPRPGARRCVPPRRD